MEFQVKIFEGGVVGLIMVFDEIFGFELCIDLIYCVVCWQFVKCQVGIYKMLQCLEIFGLMKKFVCQKGFGGVCYGNKKVLQFCGGGKVFGLVVCDYGYDLLKKVWVFGLKYVLFVKVKVDSIVVVEDVKVVEVKIKVLKFQLNQFGLISVLVIDGVEVDVNFVCVFCNILYVDVLLVQGINVYDILQVNILVLIKVVVFVFEECFK